VRRRVTDLHEAQDLTQAFFAELLEKNFVGSATPARGRFRTFLLTAMQHFLSKQWDRSRAQKRGGGRPRISLDFGRAEAELGVQPQMAMTPEQYYDRQWAVTLLDEILGRLEQEFVERGKATQFRHLKGFVIGEHGESTYADVAARLEMSEAAVKMAAFRTRQRYRRLLREEIARTVVTVDEVDDEIRQLFTVLEIR
jgi:RNA polymerase sigma-70 factor (ECF subfamily)